MQSAWKHLGDQCMALSLRTTNGVASSIWSEGRMETGSNRSQEEALLEEIIMENESESESESEDDESSLVSSNTSLVEAEVQYGDILNRLRATDSEDELELQIRERRHWISFLRIMMSSATRFPIRRNLLSAYRKQRFRVAED